MKTPFFDKLLSLARSMGGMRNAHLHLCRAGTLELTEELLRAEKLTGHSHLSISAKHGIIPMIHASSDYDPARLALRVRFFLDEMVCSGTTRADTLVDVTNDRVGLEAFETFRLLKAEYQGRLDLQIGAYSPLGFSGHDPKRWALVEQAAKEADFIGGLPERDDWRLYPDHIGFDESCRRTVLLAHQLNKPLHIHVDQKNDPAEGATERVIAVLDELHLPVPKEEPMIWLIHVISPSAYDDEAFAELAGKLASRNIGVICCPSAAISMRQLRSIKTPTHNAIARVLEFLAAGVQVRIGSDNINDITSPAGTADLMDEMFVLCNAIRFYDIPILASLASGKPLSSAQVLQIREHLANDLIESVKSIELTRRA